MATSIRPESIRPDEQAPSEVVPLTAFQQRLWRLHRRRTDPAVYNVAHRIDIEGPLDTGALRRAFAELVRRHAALRARVVELGGRPMTEVLADVPVELPITDLAGRDVQRWCEEQYRPAFDLDRAPLFRLRLGRLGEHGWVLVVVLHHMVCDGWSMRLIWDELAALYAGAELPEPDAQHPDYVRWELDQLAGDGRDRLTSFWRAELAGASPWFDLPYDRPPTGAGLSGCGALHKADVPAELADRVGAAARSAGSTPYVVLAGAFALWAARACDQADLVLVVSSANRNRREHERVVGAVGDLVPVRVPLAGVNDGRELVDLFASRLYTALDHHVLPLAEMVGHTDRLYPQVLFTVVTAPPSELALPGLRTRVRSLPIPGLARTELYVVFAPAEHGMTLHVEYSTDLFDATTITRWTTQLLATLDELATELTAAPASVP